MSDFNSQMIGKTVSHYKIVELLGEGGMGIVYKAEDIKLKRTVALKFITPEAAEKEDRKTRFFTEAQAIASLSHQNINTIYEIDEVDGQIFIAMEYIDGQSLRDLIKEEPLKINQIIDTAVQIAEGLQEAHEKGVIHRDIKSSNVMLTKKNHVKIMDFGLARIVGGTRITKTATAIGTVTYMSPEQARGEMVDYRSDLWSLGIVLYEMITGRLPFDAEQDQLILYSILNKDPEPISGLRSRIPLEMERIVEKLLEKKPSERYQSARDLIVDLKRLDRDMTSGKAHTLTSVRVMSEVRKKKKQKLIPAAASLAVIILLLFMIPSVRQGLKGILGISGEIKSKGLAVLPFEVISENEADYNFCKGLVFNLTTKLLSLERFQESFWVIDAREVLKNEINTPTEAGREYGVSHAVTATWERTENNVKLMLNLTDAKVGRILSSEEIQPQEDQANIMNQLFLKTTELLDITLPPDVSRILLGGESPNTEANYNYTQGRGSLEDYKDPVRIDKAIRYFKKATEIDNDFANAFAGLGEAYWKKWDEEKDPVYIELAEQYGYRAVSMGEDLIPVRLTLGIIYRETGDYDSAVSEFKKALEIDPEYPDAYRELAIAYSKQGNLDEAESAYNKAINFKPDFWRNYSHLGYFYYRNSRFDEAVEMFKKVINLAPEGYNGYNSLGVVYHTIGNIDEALKMYQKSNELHPNKNATSNTATILFSNAKYDEAAKMYEKALTFDDTKYELWSNLGDAYRYINNLDKAKESYQKAVLWAEVKFGVNPNDVPLCGRLALYYALYGDEINAEEKIARALELQPENLSALKSAVEVYEVLNKRDKALEAVEKLLEQGGSLSEIEQNIDLETLRKDPRYLELAKK